LRGGGWQPGNSGIFDTTLRGNGMDAIMVRQARDDFEAMLTAGAMQSVAGVDVVSIVFERPGLWHVFAKYESAVVTSDQIDTAIAVADILKDMGILQ
jgi:hypothetical protein